MAPSAQAQRPDHEASTPSLSAARSSLKPPSGSPSTTICGKLEQARDAGELGLKLRVLAEVDLLEVDVAQDQQRARVLAERAGVGREEDDVAGHAKQYRATSA